MQVLAGDIGGTKTLLAVCEAGPVPGGDGALSIEVLASKQYDSRKFPGLGEICRLFAEEVQRPLPRFAGFGVAGPVANGRSQITNLPWVLDERDLAQALGIQSVRLANDFHAVALGIPAVKPKDLVTLNEGRREPRGPWALIGAGTGLGQAIAMPVGEGERAVLATEGGHQLRPADGAGDRRAPLPAGTVRARQLGAHPLRRRPGQPHRGHRAPHRPQAGQGAGRDHCPRPPERSRRGDVRCQGRRRALPASRRAVLQALWLRGRQPRPEDARDRRRVRGRRDRAEDSRIHHRWPLSGGLPRQGAHACALGEDAGAGRARQPDRPAGRCSPGSAGGAVLAIPIDFTHEPSMNRDLEQKSIDTIRFLCVDAVEKANSGHPGICMGAAPMAFVLWSRHLRFNPRDPRWANRDRFVLSAGHGSMLIYAMLHLAGFDVTMDDIKSFRQYGSKTPGHPEFHDTPGVEATTGPLGQGLSNAVGMALSQRMLAARMN